MKAIALLLLGAVLVLGGVIDATAQQGTGASGSVSTPSGSASGSVSKPADDNPSATGDRSTTPGGTGSPAASTQPGVTGSSDGRSDRSDVTVNNRDAGDTAAASPRTGDSTRIFGMSPTAAIILASALLVVVILAIVAMTRTAGSHVDIDR
jgi:hypothetical protein